MSPMANKKSQLNKYMALLFKVSLSMLMCILVCFGAGLYLDRLFNLGGILVVVGTFLGVFVGFYVVYKIISSVLK